MLKRQGATYHFRRRVPGPIRPHLRMGEVWVSLRTTDRRAARATAAGLYALTEDVFAAMTEKPTQTQDPVAAAEKLKATLDEYVKLRRENAVATVMLIGQHREAKANADAMRELVLATAAGGARSEPPPPAPTPPSPLFSALYEEFLADRSRPSKDHPGYTWQTAKDRAPWRGVGSGRRSCSPAGLAGWVRRPRRAG